MADEAEEFEEISDEEKLKIAQHFLLSSPPGQFSEVLTDVQKLVPSGLLSESVISGIARLYNHKNNRLVTSPAGNKVALSIAGEISPNHYYDPVSDSAFQVNHLTLSTSEASVPINHDGNLEPNRAVLQQKVSQYVASSFGKDIAGGSVFLNDSVITVVITGERPNLRNFWSGKWNSVWTVKQSATGATISGEIKIHAHYFEDGNVQLQTSKPIAEAAISSSSDVEFATAIVDFIKSAEGSIQSRLEEIYANMNDETFRSMRRVMPVTRTKMEWNVNAVRMNRQVRK